MKTLKVTIELEMSVPDDWQLVQTSEGTPVIRMADGAFLDMAVEPLFAANPEDVARFPKLDLVTIADFGGWKKAQPEHFGDGGTFDQIYTGM